MSMGDIICEKQECDACALSFRHIPCSRYTAQARTYQLIRILDNSDNLNSVHCLYLLFVYMYIVCFYMFYVQRATW